MFAVAFVCLFHFPLSCLYRIIGYQEQMMKYALQQKFYQVFFPKDPGSGSVTRYPVEYWDFFASWSPVPILGSMKAFFWHSTLAHFSKRHSTFRQKFSRPSTFKIQLDTQYWSLEFSCFGVLSMKTSSPTLNIQIFKSSFDIAWQNF